MTSATTEFSKGLIAGDPELGAAVAANAERRALALALRDMRKWAGLTQKALAARSGLSQSHISKMEAPSGPAPTTESLQRYAGGCGARLWIEFRAKPDAPRRRGRAEPAIAAAGL
jgi:transcriptional regulator with XRE-family HTH domain